MIYAILQLVALAISFYFLAKGFHLTTSARALRDVHPIDLARAIRDRRPTLDLDALFTEPEISRAANNLGLFDEVESEAYERGRADAEADRNFA